MGLAAPLKRILGVGIVVLTAVAALFAQDTRNVAEPHIPQSCIILQASLSAPGGVLPDNDESKLDTARIQKALDSCPTGQSVELRASDAGNVFLSGPLLLRPGVTLLVDANTVLYGSRDPRLYDVTPGSCGKVDKNGRGCKPLILAEDAPGSAIMGDGAIDARGGAKLLGEKVTWWDLAHQAKIADRSQNCPRILVVRHSNNFVLYRITLRNSPNFHVIVQQTDGFTAWGVKIDSPATARNTDGIDPSSSTNVSILYSWIRAGDDNVAIKAGRTGPSSHITVAHDHFYSGHGMSIGSETSGGVSAVRVFDLTIDGADNGIRIKSDASRGGLVQDVSYEDICMLHVKNPIVMTPHYSSRPGDILPTFRDILLKDVHSLTAGPITLEGLDENHKLQASFDNVFVDGLSFTKIRAEYASISIGPRLGNLFPTGTDVSVVRMPGSQSGTPLNCSDRFVPYPANATAPASAEAVPRNDKYLHVAADGTGDFSSVQAAVDAAPQSGANILVSPGTYREVVTVSKPNIHLIGANTDAAKTVIVFDHSAGTSGGTLHSATVSVTGDNFLAKNLTFANDWNATHPQLPAGSQALALLVTGDRAVFRNVRLLGNQDTVYAGSRDCHPDGNPCTPARQFFTHCYVAGNVDFIFGDGKAVFDHCEIHSTSHSEGFITAQARHYPEEDSGFLFDHCRLTADPGVANVYLGRPWRPYASVVFLHTEMGAQIVPAGWREWHPGKTRSLDTIYYAEYKSSGPGAHRSERDPHSHELTAAQAAQYGIAEFLDGWDPLEHSEKP